MMKKIKPIIRICLVVLLFIMIPLIPFMLSQWNDKQLLNQVSTEKIENNLKSTFPESQLNIHEKLSLLYSYYDSNNPDIILITHRQNQLEDIAKTIKPFINQEIKKLQSLNIFPTVQFNQNYELYRYISMTYSQATHPEKNITISVVSFSGKTHYFEIWMDAQTHQIYQYIFTPNKTTIDLDDDFQTKFCLDYLKLTDEETSGYFNSYITEQRIAIGVLYSELIQ